MQRGRGYFTNELMQSTKEQEKFLQTPVPKNYFYVSFYKIEKLLLKCLLNCPLGAKFAQKKVLLLFGNKF